MAHDDTIKKLQDAADKYQELQARRRTLLQSIADAYKRQATNRDVDYRVEQMKKVNGWLEELTVMFEQHPALWTAE